MDFWLGCKLNIDNQSILFLSNISQFPFWMSDATIQVNHLSCSLLCHKTVAFMHCSGPGIFGNCLFQSVAQNIFGLLSAIALYQ